MTYSLRQHFHLVTALALCFIMFGWLQNIQNRSLLPSFCKAKDTSTAYLHTSCPQNGDLLRSQGHRHPIPGVVFDHMMQFDIQGDRYIGLPLHTLPLEFIDDSDPVVTPALVTVFRVENQSPFSVDSLLSQGSDWLHGDDVLRESFLSGIIIITRRDQVDDVRTAMSDVKFPTEWNTTWCRVIPSDSCQGLQSGPHVLADGWYKAHKIYDDTNLAFVVATRPQVVPGAFSNLRLAGNYYSSIGVAVSSRIPSLTPLTEVGKPLRGTRFAVKDIFHIQGLRVTAGNRDFLSVSRPATVTCPAIQRLLDAGAELSGTLRLGSLIAREEPTESVDFQAPFNPRGDGYQSAWSSSGGSGAAIAAYDWLDFTIAQDTTGSSRRPTMANGCFGIRITQETLSMENTVPSFPRFDAPAMYTRDIAKLEQYVGTWLDQKPTKFGELPISIIYLTDFLPIPNDDQMGLIDLFIKDMEQTFGTETKKVSIADTWEAKPPIDAGGQSVQEYLADVGVNTFVYDVYHTMDEFRSRYEAEFPGRYPYINPVTRFRWNLAQEVSAADHEEGMRRLDVYRDWLKQHILQTTEKNALVVLPITAQAVDYREDPPDPPSAPGAFDGIWLAPVLQAPEISVPIGELTYHSRITKRDERLPVVVSVLAKPGSDMALIDAMKSLLDASGRPTRVDTGATMFNRLKEL